MIRYYLSEVHCKKLEVSIFKNMARILKKPVFRGGSLNYPLQGVTPYVAFNMITFPTNDELCKKPEVDISKTVSRNPPPQKVVKSRIPF